MMPYVVGSLVRSSFTTEVEANPDVFLVEGIRKGFGLFERVSSNENAAQRYVHDGVNDSLHFQPIQLVDDFVDIVHKEINLAQLSCQKLVGQSKNGLLFVNSELLQG